MTYSFSLKLPPKIIFGPGKLAELESNILRFGSQPLLLLGSRSFSSSLQYQSVRDAFARLGINCRTAHIGSEPSPQMIDSIVSQFSGSTIDLVIAIGGGATLDGGKAVSAMLAEGEEVSRFLEGVGTESPSGRKLPFIAIPTTSGTGSEATSNAVITSVDRNGFKKSLRHDNYLPDLALIDPVLTLTCPRALTVACGMDCFSQLVEGYLSANGSPPVDALALEGIRAIYRSLRPACADGGNLAARTDLSYAALLSGIVLCNSGLGTVHGFASALGGLFAIPHGVVCGTLMAETNGLTLKRLRAETDEQPALIKYAKLGEIFSNQAAKSAAWYQEYFIEELKRLTADLEIAKLSAYGVKTSDIGKIVAQTGNKYNPIRLAKEDLANILAARID